MSPTGQARTAQATSPAAGTETAGTETTGTETTTALARAVGAPCAYATGPDPERVLVLGSGPAVGWGVRSHDVGFAGQIAAQLSNLSGRGVDVDIVSAAAMPVDGIRGFLAGTRLWRYDAIVVAPGHHEAAIGMAAAEWEHLVRRLLLLLTSATSVSTRIIVCTGPAFPVRDRVRARARAHREADLRRLNGVTEAVAALFPRATHLDLADTGIHALHPDGSEGPGQNPPAEDSWVNCYREWGRSVAAALQAPLPAPKPGAAPTARDLRCRPDDERERQAALERMAILDLDLEDRLTDIVVMARSMFGTDYAAVTLADGDRVVTKAAAGTPACEAPRSSSLSAQVLRRGEATVIDDARLDVRVSGNPSVTGDPHVRFFAGYPIESPDGYRIGAICVSDREPRRADATSASLMRELAKHVERQLADLEAEHIRD